MKDNSPIELFVSKYALLCVSMSSRHCDIESLEIIASFFTDGPQAGFVWVNQSYSSFHLHCDRQWMNPERQDMSFTLFVLKVLSVY